MTASLFRRLIRARRANLVVFLARSPRLALGLLSSRILAPFALHSRQARSSQDAVTWVGALRTVRGKEHISVAGTAAVVASPDTRAEASTPAKPPRQVRR